MALDCQPLLANGEWVAGRGVALSVLDKFHLRKTAEVGTADPGQAALAVGAAHAAFRRGAPNDSEQQYRAILDDYPDDLEAEFQLADVMHQYNPLRGRPRIEARELFDRVLAFDPGFL